MKPSIPRAKKYSGRGFYSSPKDDGAYTEEQTEFLKAMDRYKRENNRPFPTWLEVFEVFVGLGYSKTPRDPAEAKKET